MADNTVVVNGDAGALLGDPGITDAEMSCLADDLRAPGRSRVAPGGVRRAG